MLKTIIRSAAIASLMLAGAAPAQDAPAPTPAPAPSAPKAAPKIVVEPAVLDLGKMPDDKGVHGEVSVRNDGTADLTISGITSTCGCTVPTLGGRKMDTDKKQAETTSVTLKPGESTVVDIEFHPGGKRGPQSQKVTLKSNDPARRETVVEVLAAVRPIVDTDPAILAFGEVERHQAKSVIATITGRTPDFAIPMVTTGSDAITAKVLDTTETEEDGVKLRHVRVEFTLNSPRAMAVAGTATIRTTDLRRRILSLPMSGTVLGDLAFEPGRVQVGIAQPGAAVEKSVRFRSRSGKPFKILDVKERGLGTSPATWTLTEAGPDAPDSFDLLLSFTAPQKPGSWKGTLVIATDVPDQEKIEVPYGGSIRPTPAQPKPAPSEPSPGEPGPAEPNGGR